MPKRTDIQRILILGSGPIVIGQAAEFDYSGVQACKVLREEGYEVVLVNSNPATIMTDPEFADATYIEPLLPDSVAAIIEKEKPDALLPTLGGQTALNLAKALAEDGTLERHGVELIGAAYDAIARAEDRDLFRQTMADAGLTTPRSEIVSTQQEAEQIVAQLGLPVVVRPAYTLGGWGGGIARTREELEHAVRRGLSASPIGQILIEESVIGWGEFELEVMRDHNDNVVIVCSIENVDPMGVHTGDSVTVAPQQTLSDALYQKLRDQAITVIRAVGVETGGSNVQFAVNPATEEIVVIEMNPRVSRSSALASKATGFPIAKIAARLAVGYALEEIPNDITRATPASFEPAIDYVVVKWPRFAFEKFAGVEAELTTHMKSVGEVMAIGRTFGQAFVKAMQSRELDATPHFDAPVAELLDRLERPSADRYDVLLEAFRRGAAIDDVHARTHIDPWFLHELAAIAREDGATFAGTRTFKSVDTCAAEFAAETPYYYSGWERPGPGGIARHEVVRGDRKSVVILGSGPNRIGQGIEFDYCCVHAAMTVRESGRDAVMINCNPETVSTDYDTSDRLYFEPLTIEDVLGVIEVEQPEGVIVQFGGQTPLKLAAPLADAGVKLLGTSVEAIDVAEDRGRFGALLDSLGYQAPPYGTAHSVDQALAVAGDVGYPLLVRPSYVLGGRAMEIVYSGDGLRDYLIRTQRLRGERAPDLPRPLPRERDRGGRGRALRRRGGLDRRDHAARRGGRDPLRRLGVRLPPHSLGEEMLAQIREQTAGIALALGVVGLLNVQFAIKEDGELYVIEANPRASRTVPFVSKAIGIPLAKMACRVMLGERIADLGLSDDPMAGLAVSVKEAVLRSTGSPAPTRCSAPRCAPPARSWASPRLPDGVRQGAGGGRRRVAAERDRLRDRHRLRQVGGRGLAVQLHDLGFRVVATRGTAQAIARMGVPAVPLNKIGEGSPHVVDWIERGDVDLVINTPTGSGARSDGWEIRRAAVARGIPCITTLSGALAATRAIRAGREAVADVRSLQEIHGWRTPPPARTA